MQKQMLNQIKYIPLVMYFKKIILQVLRERSRSMNRAKQCLTIQKYSHLRVEIERCPEVSSLPKIDSIL